MEYMDLTCVVGTVSSSGIHMLVQRSVPNLIGSPRCTTRVHRLGPASGQTHPARMRRRRLWPVHIGRHRCEIVTHTCGSITITCTRAVHPQGDGCCETVAPIWHHNVHSHGRGFHRRQIHRGPRCILDLSNRVCSWARHMILASCICGSWTSTRVSDLHAQPTDMLGYNAVMWMRRTEHAKVATLRHLCPAQCWTAPEVFAYHGRANRVTLCICLLARSAL